jgi:5-methylphenazine-1-carboxylate 1-monooxygenase
MKVLIAGGGIGGFATALSLHAVGVECEVFEQSTTIRELGVGINVLPHAVKELAGLGLLDALDRVAVRTSELAYTNRFGQQIWREPRGLEAGYDFPQLSIGRGNLLGVLCEAVRARIGDDHVHAAHQLRHFTQDDHGVTATLRLVDGSDGTVTARGDALIAADGIHSTVRRTLYPGEGPPTWNGIMLWRGVVEHPPILTGRSMVVGGMRKARLALYPIALQTATPGTSLLNWAVAARLGAGAGRPPRREDWNRLGRPDELVPQIDGAFELSVIDPVEIVRTTREFFEFPMCDRDPVPRWSFGRVTLLGDAAHPMYPFGSNGASQAILDARSVAPLLAGTKDVAAALRAYEATRLPATTRIVNDNRCGGPERVIDLVEDRAPSGFIDLERVASHAEREAIVKGYARTAGFDQDQVNR